MNGRALGLVMIAAAAGGAVWWYQQPGRWQQQLEGVTTRHGGDSDATRDPSAAQILQQLEKDEARLDREIADQRAYIETEYQRRRDRLQFGTAYLDAKVREACSDVTNLNPFNPWGHCDDGVRDWELSQLERWRSSEEGKLRQLEQQLREVQAEISSVVVTTA